MRKLIIGMAIIFGLSVGVNAQEDKKIHQTLNIKQQKLVSIASLTAIGDINKLKIALNAGLDAGLTINEIKEALVHVYAYSGFPRSIRGLQTFMSVLDARKAKGITDKQGKPASPVNDNRSKYERGTEILTKLSGVNQNGPQTGYAAFSPEIEVFLKEHLFADLFERDILSFVDRELVTVSVISSLGGLEPMLKSHFSICLNLGLSSNQLQHFIRIIQSEIGQKQATETKVVLDLILKSNK